MAAGIFQTCRETKTVICLYGCSPHPITKKEFIFPSENTSRDTRVYCESCGFLALGDLFFDMGAVRSVGA